MFCSFVLQGFFCRNTKNRSYVVEQFPKHPSYSKTHPKIVELRKEAAKVKSINSLILEIIGDLEQIKQNLTKLYQQQEEAKRNPPK